MLSAYNALCNARISDSNWEPSIYVDIKSPNCITKIIPSYVDIKNVDKTNIVPLMAPPSSHYETILSQILKYPKGASFCFEGFHGLDDKDRLVSHIIDCAKKIDGTQLVQGRYNKNPNIKK